MDQMERSEMVGKILGETLKPVVDKMRVVFAAVGNAFKSLVKTANSFSRITMFLARKHAHLIDRSLSIACPRRDREPVSRVFPGGVWFGRQMMNRHAWRWVPRQM